MLRETQPPKSYQNSRFSSQFRHFFFILPKFQNFRFRLQKTSNKKLFGEGLETENKAKEDFDQQKSIVQVLDSIGEKHIPGISMNKNTNNISESPCADIKSQSQPTTSTTMQQPSSVTSQIQAQHANAYNRSNSPGKMSDSKSNSPKSKPARVKGAINASLRAEIVTKARQAEVSSWKSNAENFLTMDADAAKALDSVDELAYLRERFRFPPKPDGTDALYFCGHSLGLMPKRSQEILNEEMEKWANMGVHGHMEGERPWVSIDEKLEPPMAGVVGAKRSEVCVMNSLTVNLHLLLTPFWRPQGDRKVLLFEDRCFSSDYYAFCSFAHSRGWDPEEVVVPVVNNNDGNHLPPTTEDILWAIQNQGEKLKKKLTRKIMTKWQKYNRTKIHDFLLNFLQNLKIVFFLVKLNQF